MIKKGIILAGGLGQEWSFNKSCKQTVVASL